MKRSKLMFYAVSAASIFTVAITISSASLAADVAAEPVPYDWTGFYIGAHAGYGWADGEQTFNGVRTPGFDTSAEGFVGGGQAGFNWQWDQIVLGIEGDVSFADLSDTVDPFGFDVEQNVDMLASIRGRIGFAADRFLPYVTAGWGFADAERTTELGGGVSDSQSHDGLVYGGGIEYAVTDAISMRAEYLHYDLGEESYDLGLPSDPEIDLDVDVFRIGVNFNF
jgi:outer membrane immunogenic protein